MGNRDRVPRDPQAGDRECGRKSPREFRDLGFHQDAGAKIGYNVTKNFI